MQDRFFPSAISADGRVLGGQHEGVAVRWTPEGGFVPIDGIYASPEALSCTGEVAIGRGGSSAVGAIRETTAGGAQWLFGGPNDYVFPLSLSPDGSVVLGNLDNQLENPGPFPVRWTLGAGTEELTDLRGSLVYRASEDGQTLLGADILHIFRWHAGAPKTVLLPQAPLAFDGPPIMPVSADLHVYAFTSRTSLDSFIVGHDTRADFYSCPIERCGPVDVSGTGKAVLLWNGAGNGGTLVWTEAHGFRSLTELVTAFGGDVQGRILNADEMSDDGQAFTGTAVDPNNPLDYQGFYATLPLAAYD